MSSRQLNGLTVEAWPIDRPQPYFRNPRVVTAQAIDKVAASLKEFGWRQPIVVDSEEIVVVGHTRLLAARKLGYLTVPVHVAADLTPQQANRRPGWTHGNRGVRSRANRRRLAARLREWLPAWIGRRSTEQKVLDMVSRFG